MCYPPLIRRRDMSTYHPHVLVTTMVQPPPESAANFCRHGMWRRPDFAPKTTIWQRGCPPLWCPALWPEDTRPLPCASPSWRQRPSGSVANIKGTSCLPWPAFSLLVTAPPPSNSRPCLMINSRSDGNFFVLRIAFFWVFGLQSLEGFGVFFLPLIGQRFWWSLG